MKKERPYSATNPDRFILNTALLLIGAITSFTLFGRKSKKSGGSYYDPKNPVPYPPGSNPHKSSTFYKLRLAKGQYDTLKSYGGSTLVFQFFYPEPSDCGSPTLYSYAMKKYHQSIKKPPQVLSYGAPTQEPLTGRAQVLGDMQIKTSTLDNLIKRVKGSSKAHFNNLVFTPIYLPANPHMAFEISVDDSFQSERCDPSPPYSAD
jgi:hypothetical protein